MCEFTDKKHFKRAMKFFHNNNISDPRHPEIMKRFAHAFEPSHCPVCGDYLSERERRPNGLSTRSMCSRCYEALIENSISYDCFLCGGRLPDSKIQAQRSNIREISEHIHDDNCFEYWTVMHNTVVDGPSKPKIPVLIPRRTPSSLLLKEPMDNRLQIEYSNPNNFIPSPRFHNGKAVKVLR